MNALLPTHGDVPVAEFRALSQGLAVAAYAACQAGLVAYSSHRWSMLGAPVAPAAPAPVAPREADRVWPFVTVQLPLFDERRVVTRLIDAVAALDYPGDRLEIQVLDDSTDETRTLAAAAVARHRATGLAIRHLRRDSRTGFKAGALAAGLRTARGDLVAVFDADFLPAPDFLRRMVPHLDDPRVGLAQARWGHLNRARSALTAAQAVMLDAHFLLEHATRMRRGLFFNFNGTAGVWRRACIEGAGGWSHDTLTEDLDLSYRAQLAGWRFVFDPSVVVPAELPADMEGFKSQQRRWARGAIQTARKVLPSLLRAPLPARVKLEAVFHLTANVAYPLLVALALLLLPVLLGRSTLSPLASAVLQGGVIALGVLPVTLFLARGQRAAGASGEGALRGAVAALVLGVGLSLNNARAAISGLGPAPGAWVRTPKTGEFEGDARSIAYPASARRAGWGEALLAGYALAVFAWAASTGRWQVLPFLALLAAGFGWVAWGSHEAVVTRAAPSGAEGGTTRGVARGATPWESRVPAATAARSSSTSCP